MEYSKVALSCNDQLPLAAGDAHDKVAEIIEEGGKGAVSHAKAILKSSGVSDQCVAIFELVCGKAQSFAANCYSTVRLQVQDHLAAAIPYKLFHAVRRLRTDLAQPLHSSSFD